MIELTRERGMSTILITHDLGLAAAYCDRVVVMQKGKVVETAESRTIFQSPAHPYTRKLMKATPRPGVVAARPAARGRDAAGPAAVAGPQRQGRQAAAGGREADQGVPAPVDSRTCSRSCSAAGRRPSRRVFRAVDGISFSVDRGESVGLVGESGCGKSTTSTMVMRLLDKSDGIITFDGEDIGAIPAKQFAKLPMRKRIQMVFQDPTDSLNPRFTAARAIADPILRLGDVKRRRRRAGALRGTGAPGRTAGRICSTAFPHQLSGGQKARVGIARAIALNPELVILDEPTAALDVSVQAVVLNLLQDLKESLGMSYLFVSHDLNVVRLLCDRVIVMRSGKIVEQGADRARAGFAGERLHARTAGRHSASAGCERRHVRPARRIHRRAAPPHCGLRSIRRGSRR